MCELLSIIVPCYNEQEVLEIFNERITAITDILVSRHDLSVELLFVDDGSSDRTVAVLKNIVQMNSSAKYLSFTRNFGKEAALLAGLENCSGDYITLMDADLQDPPELLLEMFAGIKCGEYDCVAARRINRKGEPLIRSFFARKFYKLIQRLTKLDIVDGARDFRMMTREMKDAILALTEKNRFSKGLFTWVGYRTKWLEFENVKREKGETKWSLMKLVVYALDGIVAFSTSPLMLTSIIGLLLCLLSFVLVGFIIVRKAVFGDPVAGWASTSCIILFASGIQCFCMGILGVYLSKTYSEVKNRPVYILRKNTDQITVCAQGERKRVIE